MKPVLPHLSRVLDPGLCAGHLSIGRKLTVRPGSCPLALLSTGCFFFFFSPFVVLIVLSRLLPRRSQCSSAAFAFALLWFVALRALLSPTAPAPVFLFRGTHIAALADQNSDITAKTRTHSYGNVEGDTNISAPYGPTSSLGPLRLSTSVSCLQRVRGISAQACTAASLS